MRFSKDHKNSLPAERLLNFCAWWADRRALPWIPEFLHDSDPDIQAWGIGVLDQLLYSELTWPDEAEKLIETAELHQNNLVREGAERIRRYLRTRSDMHEPTDPASG